MEAMEVSPAETAMLGDQILTDCFAGKHIGLCAIIVPPIKDKTNLFFRFKRFLERPFIRKYAKQKGYQPWMAFWKIKQ
jgi:predicted HAD superfamily phosphohydrolase YqeG